jgi:prevent-host-death family protein
LNSNSGQTIQIVSVHQAKDRFSALLQAVEAGDEVVITRHGKKIARIVHEPDAQPAQAERERMRQQALERLTAFQAHVKPAVEGHSDWKSLRDAGRR